VTHLGSGSVQHSWVAVYEQGQKKRRRAPLLGKYVRRWLGWATGGVAEATSVAKNDRMPSTVRESRRQCFDGIKTIYIVIAPGKDGRSARTWLVAGP
jgi:hypothetical protein